MDSLTVSFLSQSSVPLVSPNLILWSFRCSNRLVRHSKCVPSNPFSLLVQEVLVLEEASVPGDQTEDEEGTASNETGVQSILALEPLSGKGIEQTS